MRDGDGGGPQARLPVDLKMVPGGSERFKNQVEFLLEIDALKHTLRRSVLLDSSRRENSVEHSWHIALAAMMFSEYADGRDIDKDRVVRMLLLHDLVEIDAGDTYCYDEPGKVDQKEREDRAADRIFGLLPPDQAREFRTLWDEFEDRLTPEAKFAHAMDRFQAFLQNYYTRGLTWRQHGIRKSQVQQRMQPVQAGAPRIWDFVETLIDDAVARGFLLP
jgi:putative hydrolase of HD superfamily